MLASSVSVVVLPTVTLTPPWHPNTYAWDNPFKYFCPSPSNMANNSYKVGLSTVSHTVSYGIVDVQYAITEKIKRKYEKS